VPKKEALLTGAEVTIGRTFSLTSKAKVYFLLHFSSKCAICKLEELTIYPQMASRIFIRITRHTGINAAASDTTSKIKAMRAV
jgi:hypothetical protein